MLKLIGANPFCSVLLNGSMRDDSGVSLSPLEAKDGQTSGKPLMGHLMIYNNVQMHSQIVRTSFFCVIKIVCCQLNSDLL